MLWRKKKKRKKATKPKAVTQTAAPQQPVEEIPQTTKSEKKEETPKQKKARGGKIQKGFIAGKSFLRHIRTINQSAENYWFTPIYFSPIWTTRRLFGRC